MAVAPAEIVRSSSWPRPGEVFAGEGRAWIFVAKSLLALYLAAWLAMWLHLEEPATSMITVGVVMRPQSGTVLAKSFYRTLGTLCGSVFGVLIMSAFPQQRVLFLLCMSLWVGLCAGGATLYRNFMAYGFVLAGYTAAIVALPAIGQPGDIFHSAVMRVSEVMLGILVSGIVSDAVLPERLRKLLRLTARRQFERVVDFMRGSTGGGIPRADMEQAHLRSVRAAVELENLRASVIFEDPEARARSRHVRALNQRYMALATSFQSLHRLIDRLQRAGRERVANALIALYRPIGNALSPAPELQHDPATLAARLQAYIRELPARTRALDADFSDATGKLEFDTGAALVMRFATELHGFVSLQGALRAGRLEWGIERVAFRRGNDYPNAAIAVLRTFLTMSVLSTFWLASAWSDGASAMLLATIFSGLYAASPNPTASAARSLAGFTIGMLIALFVVFAWMPDSEGFSMLILATAPFLAIGPYLTTRASLLGVGSGYALGFVSLLALQNPMVYDPVTAINGGIAQWCGVALAAVVFVFVPRVTGSRWQRMRQMRRLREQVEQAAVAPLDGLSWRLESVSRDLFHQVITHTRPGSEEARNMLAWALSVQECGRVLIELRHAMRRSQPPAAVRDAVLAAVHAVGRLYRRPDSAHWRSADDAVATAMAACSRGEDAGRRLLAQLRQLRGVLHDDESPMAPLMPVQPEPMHAA